MHLFFKRRICQIFSWGSERGVGVGKKKFRIKERILGLPPLQCTIQLCSISRLLGGSGAVIDLKLTKGTQKEGKCPKSTPKKKTEPQPGICLCSKSWRKKARKKTGKTKRRMGLVGLALPKLAFSEEFIHYPLQKNSSTINQPFAKYLAVDFSKQRVGPFLQRYNNTYKNNWPIILHHTYPRFRSGCWRNMTFQHASQPLTRHFRRL
ncbi:hypothetical protein VP01_1370g2 [Puccinia sorghi]|uniref:Uncharacterized protein n=1 Tax=Puccinia sorghi TaxID=27349 RepID=A0A0L6VLU9_9BASI|nr:hypothetical protein VP01_1370g2 [Puccinia sorghi]